MDMNSRYYVDDSVSNHSESQNPNAKTFREENQGGLRSSQEDTKRERWDVTKTLTFLALGYEALGLGSNDGDGEIIKSFQPLPFGISLGLLFHQTGLCCFVLQESLT